MNTGKLSLAVGLAASLLLGSAAQAAAAETPYGTSVRPLDGQRFTTLCALASHLGDTARGALEGAADETRRGVIPAARLLSSMRTFAHDADAFRRMLNDYPTSPFDVPPEVAELTTAAQQLNESVRAARGLETSYSEWQAIVDVLERMRLLLSGNDVQVPVAHVIAPLLGARLEEFQKLAGELAISTERAQERARRDLSEYPDRGQQFLGELSYFATQVRKLNERPDASRVEPQKLGPLVDQLLEEARQADRRMRDAHVFRAVWDDSGRTITILHRMASLVRS